MSIIDTLLGRSLANSEEEGQKVGVAAGVSALGLDGLSSAAYGPEAALTILLPLGVIGLRYIGPITALILILLTILYLSYRQTITAYPNGGGSYTVARENLGIKAGLLAAAALMLDYVLNVAVGISAGVGALISAIPALHHYTLPLCLMSLGLLTIANLRGVREAGILFAIPTYLFIGTLLYTIVIGLVNTIHGHGHPMPIVAPPAIPGATEAVGAWLLVRAFASGCTAMTGVEAVSNGVSIFAKPTVPNAQRTLSVIVFTLIALLAGIAYLCRAYHIAAMTETSSAYQTVLSQLSDAIVGRGPFYYVTLGSTVIVLGLSANTSYAGFPRLCRLVAIDGYLPMGFRMLGRRLVYTAGILFLTTLAGILLIVFHGITDRLIPLFAVGAFLAFTLSQAGMVAHWRKVAAQRVKDGKGAGSVNVSMLVNGVGAVCTAIALAVILFAKFIDGAWITLVIMPALLAIFASIKRHYAKVAKIIAYDKPLNVSDIQRSIVIVPIEGWNLLSTRAILYSLRMSTDVRVVHFDIVSDIPTDQAENTREESSDTKMLRSKWGEYVESPIAKAGLPCPELVIIPSPYRRIAAPLLDYIKSIKTDTPSTVVSVVIPELVETKWWEAILHNHRATAIKASLLFQGDWRTVVINVPWYLE